MSSSRYAQGPRGDGRRWPIRADHETAEGVDRDRCIDLLGDVRWPAHQRAGSHSADGRNHREVADAKDINSDLDDDTKPKATGDTNTGISNVKGKFTIMHHAACLSSFRLGGFHRYRARWKFVQDDAEASVESSCESSMQGHANTSIESVMWTAIGISTPC